VSWKICGTEETDNRDGICDDCKFCIINDKNIPPDFLSGNHERFLLLLFFCDETFFNRKLSSRIYSCFSVCKKG